MRLDAVGGGDGGCGVGSVGLPPSACSSHAGVSRSGAAVRREQRIALARHAAEHGVGEALEVPGVAVGRDLVDGERDGRMVGTSMKRICAAAISRMR